MSEAAGVNSAAGSFGLSFGQAFARAIMMATLSLGFTNRKLSFPAGILNFESNCGVCDG